jgi:RimJ/RimL family protein N-acetyltransferase
VTDRLQGFGPEQGRNPRLRLERVGVARARAIVAGDMSAVDPAPGWPHADSLDAIRMDADHAADDDQTGFLAVLLENSQVVGDAGWKGGPDESGTVEVGYGLAAPYRGRGLGTELVALVTEWALDQPGVSRVTAQVLVGNEPSLRALLRNGFAVVGAGEQPDGPHLLLARGEPWLSHRVTRE